MNQLELKPNQQVGIVYYDNDRLGSKAEIGVVAKISPTGQVTHILHQEKLIFFSHSVLNK